MGKVCLPLFLFVFKGFVEVSVENDTFCRQRLLLSTTEPAYLPASSGRDQWRFLGGAF
jgi:hypothetical protein